MFPGPNALANVVLNIIIDVEAHHVLWSHGRRFAAPVALPCVRGDFVSKSAGVQFEAIDRTARGNPAHSSTTSICAGSGRCERKHSLDDHENQLSHDGRAGVVTANLILQIL
jgi:hypothetical protein